MAELLGIIESALGIFSGALDVVGIFDQESFTQLFRNARPLKAGLRPSSQLMNHPAETGVILSDHKVVNQLEIEMQLLISAEFYGSVYQQIKAAYDKSTLLIVQTRSGVNDNMIIQEMPTEEKPEVYNALVMTLRLKEVFFAPAPSTYDPEDPTNDDTVRSGQQQGKVAPTPTNSSQYTSAAGAW